MASQSARAEEIAHQFEQLNDEVIAFVEGCDEGTWQTTCPGEERPIAAVAAHVAGAYPVVAAWMRSVASGQPVAVTMNDIHAANAHAAAKDAARSRADVAQALRRNGELAAGIVRGLDDESLARSAPFGPAGGTPLTAATVAEYVLLRHPREHLATMRKAIAE